jgi:hypothetical protein
MIIKEVISTSIKAIIQNRVVLFKALWLLFLLHFILSLLNEYLKAKLANQPFNLLLVYFAIFVFQAFIFTKFAVITHRIVLLGPDDRDAQLGEFEWSKRESRFTLNYMGILLFISILIVPIYPVLHALNINNNSFAVSVGTGFVCLWLFSRWSLVFPAIAIDEPASQEWAWQVTKSHQTKMFLVTIAYPFILFLILIPISFIFVLSGINIDTHSIFFIIFAKFIGSLLIIFEVTALSVAYRVITTID